MTETEKSNQDNLMEMSWEILQPVRAWGYLSNSISIQANGRLSWGTLAHQAMGEPEKVELLINRGKKAVALRPAAKEGFTATACKESSTVHTIHVAATLKANGILCGKAVRKEFSRMGSMIYIIVPELFPDQ